MTMQMGPGYRTEEFRQREAELRRRAEEVRAGQPQAAGRRRSFGALLRGRDRYGLIATTAR